jgi:lipopolysaccharide/colanic/teichoic acid biosynthesis glycosyltransferase
MKKRISKFILCLIDIGIFVIAFLFAAWLKPATVRVYIPNYWKPVTVFLIIWICVSLYSNKYRTFKERRFSSILSSIISTAFISTAIIVILMFALKQTNYSRLIVLGTLLIATFLEVFLSWAYYYSRKYLLKDPDFSASGLMTHSKRLENGQIDTAAEYHLQNEEKYIPQFSHSADFQPFQDILKDRYLTNEGTLFDFINSSIDLNCFDKNSSDILDTATIFNFKKYDDTSLEFLVNLHQLNDFRRINEYFIEVNRILQYGGVFVSCGQTLEERSHEIKQKYIKVLAYPILFFDFLFNRVFPKLDILKGIYFSITKGENRPISRCEILGRLYYCGFDIIATREIDNHLFFVAVKKKEPDTNPDPSYGPLYKKRAIGKNEKYIYVYKFRTMHPYSEYVHDYMVKNFGYNDIGKPANDFRITQWGRWMRRLWLDELPQLLNVLKGEMKLVGIRPITMTFLNEFPEDVRKLRAKYKPGCIPAYVSLLKQSKDGFIEAETIYLREKESHPIWTDIKYFSQAIFNIVTGKIRSD